MAFSLAKLLNDLKKPFTTVTATTVVVSAIWFFFYSRMLEIKNERITQQQDEIQRISRIAAIPDTIEKLDSRLKSIEMKMRVYNSAFPYDELTGRMIVGQGIDAPTSITILMADGEALVQSRKFDLAEQKADEMERLIPGFTGALYLRFQIAAQKGYADDAILFGEQVLNRLPKDERVKECYKAVIVFRIQKKQLKKAEELGLAMARAFPNDTNAVRMFEETFRYKPFVSTNGL
jgi:hypothetical protein